MRTLGSMNQAFKKLRPATAANESCASLGLIACPCRLLTTVRDTYEGTLITTQESSCAATLVLFLDNPAIA
jgi:hypothetical protein